MPGFIFFLQQLKLHEQFVEFFKLQQQLIEQLQQLLVVRRSL